MDDTPLTERLRDWALASGCRLCVLFGSRTTGSADTRMSADVDLALDLRPLPAPERRLELIGELQDICGAAPADVVFLNLRTDPVLRFEVFRGGVPIYEEHPGLFIDEKVRALMLYEDALPFRRSLRKRLRDQAVEVRDVT